MNEGLPEKNNIKEHRVINAEKLIEQRDFKVFYYIILICLIFIVMGGICALISLIIPEFDELSMMFTIGYLALLLIFIYYKLYILALYGLVKNSKKGFNKYKLINIVGYLSIIILILIPIIALIQYVYK